MGLDITAYEKVTLVREMTVAQANAEDYDPYPNPETLLYVDHPSRTQHDGMAEGAYSYEGETVAVCAGSYHGYNAWRSWLSTVGAGAAFRELVNFADNEGFIGPKTSAKLAADFARWRPRAAAMASQVERGGWLIGKYDEWARAFAVAAKGGAVKFH